MTCIILKNRTETCVIVTSSFGIGRHLSKSQTGLGIRHTKGIKNIRSNAKTSKYFMTLSYMWLRLAPILLCKLP